MKIGVKLTAGFSGIGLLMVVIVLISYLNFSDLEMQSKEILSTAEKVKIANEIIDNINGAALQARNIIILKDADRKLDAKNKQNSHSAIITQKMNELKGKIKTEEGLKRLDNVEEARSNYRNILLKVIDLGMSNKTDEASQMLVEQLQPLHEAYLDAVDKMIEFQTKLGEEAGEKSAAMVSNAIMILLILMAVGIIVAVIISIFVTRSIVNPIKTAIAVADRMAEGDLNVKFEAFQKDETGLLMQSLEKMNSTLNNALKEVNELGRAAVEGRLETRADANKYLGDYKTLVVGINNMLDAIINPLNVAAAYVEKISQGDIPSKITDVYKGNFNEIKNNLNKLIDALNLLIHDAFGMAQAADEGNLKYRADESKHFGDLKKIIQGMNKTTENFVDVLNVSSEFIRKVSAGEQLTKITEVFHGDYNEIKNSVNVTVEILDSIRNEINALISAAIEGQLNERANASEFKGSWLILVNGLNRMLDEILRPLTEGIRVLKLISGGNLREQFKMEVKGEYKLMQDSVNGVHDWLTGLIQYVTKISNGDMAADFAKASNDDQIHEWLILLRENIKSITQDIRKLADSASKGDLKYRADARAHKGDFAKIIEGINHMLDILAQPVDEAVSVLKNMADGDMTRTMQGDYHGDHATLKNSLNDTIESINQILVQVRATVAEVNRGANQVAEASTALSQGATEQAASLEEITSSMSELGSQTRNNAEKAGEANKLSLMAKESADKGNEEMNELNGAMDEITESSKNISKIIKVIDEIAFQTNLLALNAAVEAARAGRHGKGFAVVAEEVRNLAARSATAAKETSDLIEGTIKTVDRGSELAGRTRSALEEIKASSDNVTDIVAMIASSSVEQASGISQINEGLVQIDKVTQTNTASAEESASASEELAGQASQLENMIMRFKLSEMNYSYDQQSQAPRLKKNNGRGAALPALSSAARQMINLEDDNFGKY